MKKRHGVNQTHPADLRKQAIPQVTVSSRLVLNNLFQTPDNRSFLKGYSS
ncbi:unnamed protein product [Arabidopsis halleri]